MHLTGAIVEHMADSVLEEVETELHMCACASKVAESSDSGR